MCSSDLLARGLELPGVIWAGIADTNLAAQPPVITAGDVPLVTAREDALGRQQIALQFTPAPTTLQFTPNWPIFWWNLLNWRSREMPGLDETNFRLGAEVLLRTTNGPARLVRPDRTAQDFPRTQRLVAFEIDAPGVYEAIHGGETNSFAVNFLGGDESDLSDARTERKGRWHVERDVRHEYAAVLWVFVVSALVGLAAHLFMLARGRGEAGA